MRISIWVDSTYPCQDGKMTWGSFAPLVSVTSLLAIRSIIIEIELDLMLHT
jgi:hypothetical protein